MLKVFEPVRVNAPAPPWLSVQLYVDPPPTNVFAEALVRLMVPVPVPAVVVNPVGTALLNAVAPDAVTKNVPPLNVKFLVPVAVRNVDVNVWPLRSSVPLVSTIASLAASAFVSASCSVTVPPGESTTMAQVNDLVALVIVWLPRPENIILTILLWAMVTPVPLTQLPSTGCDAVAPSVIVLLVRAAMLMVPIK